MSKLLFPAGLIITTVAILVYLPPQNDILRVLTFILLLSSTLYSLISLFLPKRYASLTGLFVGLFLILNYLIGFQILNTLLLISFIIGIGYIVSIKK